MNAVDVPHYDVSINIDGDIEEMRKTVSNLITTKIKPDWTNKILKYEVRICY